MKKKIEEDEELTAPFWMTTYGDMVTLMLTFFILLVSYSTIELEKFRGAMESLKGALGIFEGHESPQKSPYLNFDTNTSSRRADLNDRAKQMEAFILADSLQHVVEFEILESGVLLRLGQEVLFDVGSVELKDEAHKILAILSEILRADLKEIQVEGHTDDVPIRTTRFPSNWELSAARALSVVRYFFEVEGIPEKHLVAVGRGEHRPLVANDSRENRRKNRRVEIMIKWTD